jgi:hypothetical protein
MPYTSPRPRQPRDPMVTTAVSDMRAGQYCYYDNPENGDLHMMVPAKILAFRGPRDAVDHWSRFRCLQPSDYIEVFKTLKVSTIVRLNKAEYSRKPFTAAGFELVDQVF